MDKDSKHLSIIYENKIAINEGMGTRFGNFLYDLYSKVTGKKTEGVTGIVNRWSAGRAAAAKHLKFREYSTLKNNFDYIFNSETLNKFKTAKQKEDFIKQEVQKLAPQISSLGVPWSEVMTSQQTGKVTKNITDILSQPVNNIINEMVQKTQLPPNVITSILWEPSANEAKAALKAQMPLISNLGKSARFWVVWYVIIKAMFTLHDVLSKGWEALEPWLDNIQKAGEAVKYGGEKIGETMDKVGDLALQAEAFLTGVPYTPEAGNSQQQDSSQQIVTEPETNNANPFTGLEP